MTMVRFTTFENRHDIQGSPIECQWDKLAALLSIHEVGSKDGKAIAGCLFRGTRRKDLLQQRDIVLLDIEQRKDRRNENGKIVVVPVGPHPPPPQDVVARLLGLGLASVVYTSHSHRVDAPRYRVVVPLNEPFVFDGDGARALDALAVKRVAEDLGLLAFLDTTKCTGESLFFLPRHPPGTTDHFAEAANGAPLDTDRLYASVLADDDEEAPEPTRAEQAADDAAREGATDPIIATFNASHRIEDLLAKYGYKQARAGSPNWRSPYQNSDSFATEVLPGNRWRSLSGSDAVAGVGHSNGTTCHGDAFDLFVHYEHAGNFAAALNAAERLFAQAANNTSGAQPAGGLGEWNAGTVDLKVPPRQWLLGNVFCKGFVSSGVTEGGGGKTALRIAQSLALATGRELTGEHVFRRSRVLYISLEDDDDEMKRRLKAAMIFYGIEQSELDGWLYVATPKGLRLAEQRLGATPDIGPLRDALVHVIESRAIDLVVVDPFVKSHGVEENSNSAIDFVVGLLAQIAITYKCAVDIPHHVNKGTAAAPGDANRARGASAFKDAARLVYSLTPMTSDEAKLYRVPEEERRLLFRVDSAKVNIAPPSAQAQWWRLVGVPIGNPSETYPNGDTVQVATRWKLPDLWEGVSDSAREDMLAQIDKGLEDGRRYSHHHRTKEEQQAWRVVQRVCPTISEGQAKQIIAMWLKTGILVEREYRDPVERKTRLGLFINRGQPEPEPGLGLGLGV